MALSAHEFSLICDGLNALHRAASAVDDWDGKQGRTFINVGEYGLALDEIAYAYLDAGRTMPPDMFEIFEKVAVMMDLGQDPEFDGVARLRANVAKSPS